MFSDLLRKLTSPATRELPDTDARLAIGALLVRIAKSDGHYEAAEIQRIDRILGQRFGLNPIGAAQLRAKCEKIEHDAPDTVRFTRVIKDAIPLEDRVAVVRAMWEVVLVDGEREDSENALMRMVAPMLGLTDQDSNRIRIEVENAR